MNDSSLEYAKMIEIPTSSCEYAFKRKKKFFNKKSIIKKINSDIDLNDAENCNEFCTNDCSANCKNDCTDNDSLVLKRTKKSEKDEKFKSRIITAQVVAIATLCFAIILTNVFWENSGINQLFKSVFYSENSQDARSYDDFTLTLPVKSEGVTLLDGVLYIEGEYSVYPICEGSIKNVERASDGSFTVTVYHSDSFSSVIEGADYVYFSEGDKVNANVPVCHTSKSAKIYLYDNGDLLTDFSAIENSIVFNK